VNQPATVPIVDAVSQLKMNWGELKRNVLFPFAPRVGEYSRTQGGTADDAGGTVLPVVGHACISRRVLKSLIGFPLASRISHLMGTAEPCFLVPENEGAEIGPYVLIGDKKPTNWHGTETGGVEMFEGILSRPSLSTVVTK
jgi:hypothetical protein